MKNDKIKMLNTANKLREILFTIEDLLVEYKGNEGNKNYVRYCLKKVEKSHDFDDELTKLFNDTFNINVSERKGINIATLVHIIEKQFKLLDDIDTAGDIFKPEWCKITKTVELLHRLRWLYCNVEGDNKDNDGVMNINGECYKKEDKVILNF